MIGAKVEAKMKILYERNRDYIENEKLLRKSVGKGLNKRIFSN